MKKKMKQITDDDILYKGKIKSLTHWNKIKMTYIGKGIKTLVSSSSNEGLQAYLLYFNINLI